PPPADDSPCAAVSIRVRRVERAAPVPLHLARGGHRVLLVFRNDGDEAVEVGPLSEATFADDHNRALHPARLPSESRGWFMPFTVPAHGTAVRSVVFEGEDEPSLSRVEARRSSPADQPLATCVVRQSGM
ncbi:MAG TPA: hypothetical protein RMH99_06075, partial [Sandaracinaceae bacterium LLY-WYZ-13_1]|nr:hypothetical protein [Sandaracinaceae bacterium LLY-WYZ-13_1]